MWLATRGRRCFRVRRRVDRLRPLFKACGSQSAAVFAALGVDTLADSIAPREHQAAERAAEKAETLRASSDRHTPPDLARRTRFPRRSFGSAHRSICDLRHVTRSSGYATLLRGHPPACPRPRAPVYVERCELVLVPVATHTRSQRLPSGISRLTQAPFDSGWHRLRRRRRCQTMRESSRRSGQHCRSGRNCRRHRLGSALAASESRAVARLRSL